MINFTRGGGGKVAFYILRQRLSISGALGEAFSSLVIIYRKFCIFTRFLGVFYADADEIVIIFSCTISPILCMIEKYRYNH